MAQKSDKPSADKVKYSVKDEKVLKEIEIDLARLIKHYEPVLNEWGKTTEQQRIEFIQHSPILAKLLDWAKRWEGR